MTSVGRLRHVCAGVYSLQFTLAHHRHLHLLTADLLFLFETRNEQAAHLAVILNWQHSYISRITYHPSRDVTKFEFEFDDVRTLNVFARFEIRRMFLVLCCRMQICGKILVLQLIAYVHTARERRQTSFFLKFNLSHKLQ